MSLLQLSTQTDINHPGDRQQPCKNCLKKAREDLCIYAPKPEKARPERSMAARLKRLESMVRGMMHTNNPNIRGPIPALTSSSSATGQYQTDEHDDENEESPDERAAAVPVGQVVLGKSGKGSVTYVGATHFMAMLEDVSVLLRFDQERGVGGLLIKGVIK